MPPELAGQGWAVGALLAAAVLLFVSTATRALLALRADVPLETPARLAWAFGYGLLYDLAAAAYATAPLSAALLLAPAALARTKAFRAAADPKRASV